jgi:hypothetical protein
MFNLLIEFEHRKIYHLMLHILIIKKPMHIYLAVVISTRWSVAPLAQGQKLDQNLKAMFYLI